MRTTRPIKEIIIFILGLFFFIATCLPILLISKEQSIESSLKSNYDILYLEPSQDNIKLGSTDIKIINKMTESSSLASLQLIVNDKMLGEPFNAKLINGSAYKYWGWIGILRVKNKQDQTQSIAIVQRIPQTDEQDAKNRKWNIYHVGDNNFIEQKQVSFIDRPKDYLDIKLLMSSGTITKLMGYESDIRHQASNPVSLILVYSLFIIGIILMVAGIILYIRKKKTKLH